MNPIAKLFTFLLLLSMASVGCKKDNIATDTVTKQTITLKASLGIDTKVDFEDAGTEGIKTVWSENDAIAVYKSDETREIVGYFILSSGANTKQATFTGSAMLEQGQQYSVVYPASGNIVFDPKSNYQLGGFLQDKSNPTKHLDNVCFMKGEFSYTQSNTLTEFELKPTHSIFTLNLKKSNFTIGDAPIKVTVTSSIYPFFQTNVSLDALYSLDNDIVVYVASQPSEAVERSLKVTVLTMANKVFTQTITTSKEHKAGVRYTVDIDNLTAANNPTIELDGFIANDAPGDVDTWVFSTVKNPTNFSELKAALTKAENASRMIDVVLLNAESIAVDVFAGVTSLHSISIPMLKEVPDRAFKDCSNLNQISLPSATVIGSSAFYSNTNLTSVDLPLVKTISDFAFYGCSSMRHLSAPNVTYIDNAAFSDCNGLVTLKIGTSSTLTQFGNGGSSALTGVDLTKVVLTTNSGTPNFTTNLWTITDGTGDKKYGPFAKIIKTN